MPPISGSESGGGAAAGWPDARPGTAQAHDAFAWRALVQETPRTWLVTGAAGFIGSHLVETLLRLDQSVIGLDNFSTGSRRNLADVAAQVGASAWSRFHLVEGDLRVPADCARAMVHPEAGPVRHVLHQAALGSVPRSLRDPLATHDNNVTGFVHMLIAARDAGVESFVYASSSSVYGDHPALPKVEDNIGNALSPYAVSKRSNELYADVFARSYGMQLTGLRYFNVFGPRQDPEGPYAAVIPLWTAALLRGDTVWINGDGETSRDFCFVANTVQANLRAALISDASGSAGQGGASPPAQATAPDSRFGNARVFNVAVGERSTLNDLVRSLAAGLAAVGLSVQPDVRYREFRPGDVRHSLADIERIRTALAYAPTHTLAQGIVETLPWYLAQIGSR